MKEKPIKLGLTERYELTDKTISTETKKGQKPKGNVSETATKGGKKFTIK